MSYYLWWLTLTVLAVAMLLTTSCAPASRPRATPEYRPCPKDFEGLIPL